jgi:hypothetical protein
LTGKLFDYRRQSLKEERVGVSESEEEGFKQAISAELDARCFFVYWSRGRISYERQAI